MKSLACERCREISEKELARMSQTMGVNFYNMAIVTFLEEERDVVLCTIHASSYYVEQVGARS